MLFPIQRPILGVNVVLAALFFAVAVSGQEPPSTEDKNLGSKPQPQALTPSVSFTLDWPGSQPEHYTVLVAFDGSSDYSSQISTASPASSASESASPTSDSVSEAPFETRFTITAPIRERIFSLAQQANFFNGNFNYNQHRVADTGTKTLAYTDSARHYQTSYNWSENKAVDELTHIFEGIGSTIESGYRLQHLMRFDKLGLNQELSGMEQAAQSGQLRELQIIAPVLRQIASNSGYMNIARERARHLLQLASR